MVCVCVCVCVCARVRVHRFWTQGALGPIAIVKGRAKVGLMVCVCARNCEGDVCTHVWQIVPLLLLLSPPSPPKIRVIRYEKMAVLPPGTHRRG